MKALSSQLVLGLALGLAAQPSFASDRKQLEVACNLVDNSYFNGEVSRRSLKQIEKAATFFFFRDETTGRQHLEIKVDNAAFSTRLAEAMGRGIDNTYSRTEENGTLKFALNTRTSTSPRFQGTQKYTRELSLELNRYGFKITERWYQDNSIGDDNGRMVQTVCRFKSPLSEADYARLR